MHAVFTTRNFIYRFSSRRASDQNALDAGWRKMKYFRGKRVGILQIIPRSFSILGGGTFLQLHSLFDHSQKIDS